MSAARRGSLASAPVDAIADPEVAAGVVIDYPPRKDGGRQGPNRAQARAHAFEVDELLFGGAAGPGKTDFVIAKVLAVLFEFDGSAGVIFRRTHPQLSEAGGIEKRLLERIPTSVGTYNAGSHTWTFRNGSTLRLAHCARDADVTKYQGAEWQVVAFDQLEQFTEYQYRYLLHRLRASGAVAAAMDAAGYRPAAYSTANPGGIGHGWVKRRFIDPFPTGGVAFRPAPDLDDPNPGVRVFIPGTVEDNVENLDEGYVARLERLPEDQRRAMRHGDWNVYAGQRFRAFRTATHVVDPEDLPLPAGGIARAIGIDYGLDAPFCALWGARLADDLVVVYRELYRAELTPEQQAALILRSEARNERRPGRPLPAFLDPSTWARGPDAGDKSRIPGPKPSGPPRSSIAGRYVAAGVPVIKANNDRLAGVAEVAQRLRVRSDGRPRLLIYSTCRNLIRTLPELARDPHRPEDVDTDGEDHAYDALRYLLLGLGRTPTPRGGTSRRREVAVEQARTGAARRPTVGPTETGHLRRGGF